MPELRRARAAVHPERIGSACGLVRTGDDSKAMIYGYARVSTDGQSVEAQVTTLTDAGAEKVFREVASGAKTDLTQLRRSIDALGPGDVLMVTRLDRLARSTPDLLNPDSPDEMAFGQLRASILI